MTGLRALAELVRAPAALTVPGDTLLGAAAAGRPAGARAVGLAAASVSLYWAGMALNDYADRHIDAEERPGRPIPSGRISPRSALVTASVLTGTGLALAGASGGRTTLALALPLAATVWAYDLKLKHTPFGPTAMATARGLDVLMGAGATRWRQALAPAGTIACHTYAVTTVSRREAHGATAALPAGALAATGLIGLGAAALPPADAAPAHRATATAVLGGYLLAAGGAQLAATVRPDAAHLRRAVAAGIHAVIPLQAALTARAGSVRAALSLLAAYPLARGLARKVSPT
ncbi:SCO3242 family prenyltransferase [Kitasatospora sp. NPDC098652]|uniref:SCO3242 family prenyltransferase n=1 Tax=Kitasatospora sp. NPDC098652 TaxID=3364095 RepID=UPI0037F714F9